MISISRFRKIGTKLLIIGLLLSLAPVAILGAFLYTNTKKTLEEEATANLGTFAAVKARELTDYTDHLQDLGYYSSSNVGLVKGLVSLSKNKYNLSSLDWLNNRKPEMEEIGEDIISTTDFNIFLVLSPSGTLIYSTNPNDIPGTDFSDKDYISGAMEGEMTLSSLFYSDITKNYCLALGVPVFDPDKPEDIVGTIGLVVTGGSLKSIVQSGVEQIGSTAVSYLIDTKGTVITDVVTKDGKGLQMRDTVKGWPLEFITRASSGGGESAHPTGSYQNYADERVFGAGTVLTLGNQEYGLIIEVDESEALARAAVLQKSTLIMCSVMVVAAIAVTVGFSRTLVNPIVDVVSTVKNVAQGEGDLTKRLEVKSKDEMAELAQWFNKFLDYIAGIIKNITLTSDQLAATSQELSATSEESTSIAAQIAETAEQLASGAAEQSSIAANTAVSAEKLSSTVEVVAQGTQSQYGAVDTIAVVISESNRIFGEVVQVLESVSKVAQENTMAAKRATESIQVLSTSMANIQGANESAAIQVSELSNLSQSIRQIVGVIDDIASQTNLLALNAAIEAARAGEHGRGFAVVADEVRKLAERSLAETKNISELINKVATSIDRTVSSIEQSTQEIDVGSMVAQDAGNVLSEIERAATGTQEEIVRLTDSFERLKTASAQTETAVNDIAVYANENLAGVEEMAMTAEEVKRLVENVAAVSEESAAAIEEVAASIKEMAAAADQVSASAQDLAAQAELLQNIVRKFTI
ncbi:MAG: methyl-accepting chemotaxis protein [Firmicutes bacterium]|nr:methyl-accepting chemotaxis protein [Candidatus Fermentithermobacillaceae bacterium]